MHILNPDSVICPGADIFFADTVRNVEEMQAWEVHVNHEINPRSLAVGASGLLPLSTKMSCTFRA